MNEAPDQLLQRKPPAKSNPVHAFYIGCALVLLGITLAGFRHFYLHGTDTAGDPVPQRLVPLIVVHCIAMSAWIVLFLVQPLLIASRNRRLHMMLGWAGAAMASVIVILGALMAIGYYHARHEPVSHGLTQLQFLIVPFALVGGFWLFVLLGVLNRRRAEIHRAMMLLATLIISLAGTDRIRPVNRFFGRWFVDYLFGPFAPTLAVGALFLVAHRLVVGRFDRYYWRGYAGMLIASPLIMDFARSAAWERIATFLVR